MNRGEMPERPQGESDFYWIERTEAEGSKTTALRVITERLAKRGISTRDTIVITPQRAGVCGAVSLNQSLQEALNPTGQALTLGKAPKQTVYRVGDRVMQLKNDRVRGVFNGDMGWVAGVDPEKTTLLADIDGREVVYERQHFEHLTHAYACTGHKMQGAQAKAVIVIMLREHFMLLSRAWLYTALTRAEKLCVLIADPAAVRMALSETRRELRNTGLRLRLVDACGDR